VHSQAPIVSRKQNAARGIRTPILRILNPTPLPAWATAATRIFPPTAYCPLRHAAGGIRTHNARGLSPRPLSVGLLQRAILRDLLQLDHPIIPPNQPHMANDQFGPCAQVDALTVILKDRRQFIAIEYSTRIRHKKAPFNRCCRRDSNPHYPGSRPGASCQLGYRSE
jgi:hypothetical protein